MPRLAVLLFIPLTACLEASPPAATSRQALPGPPSTPLVKGRGPDARLGTSLAACRGPGFVAGAPGDNSALLFTDGGLWFDYPIAQASPGSIGQAVECDGTGTNPRLVTGGSGGMWSSGDGNVWTASGGANTDALARGPVSTSPLLVGTSVTGTVTLQTITALSYALEGATVGTATLGASVAWEPGGTWFAAGDPAAEVVLFTRWTPGAADARIQDAGQLMGVPSGIGDVLAIGDVHPSPGLELIVGAPAVGEVRIYSDPLRNPTLLMVLSSGGRFGASLAIEPLPTAGTLHALWVGAPGDDGVGRFVGDAGEWVVAPASNMDFGASVEATAQSLLVGAPRFSAMHPNQGAVFVMTLNPVTYPEATVMTCSVGRPCMTPTCRPGDCLGGVVCQPNSPPQCTAAFCVSSSCLPTDDGGTSTDAGTSADAGAADTGLAADAGQSDGGATTDAGTGDAGTPDAGTTGPIEFQGRGCTSGTGGPGLLLLGVLVLGARRRTPRWPTT